MGNDWCMVEHGVGSWSPASPIHQGGGVSCRLSMTAPLQAATPHTVTTSNTSHRNKQQLLTP
eukprot:363295-Chlamydomonas_euryale.AAC.7